MCGFTFERNALFVGTQEVIQDIPHNHLPAVLGEHQDEDTRAAGSSFRQGRRCVHRHSRFCLEFVKHRSSFCSVRLRFSLF